MKTRTDLFNCLDKSRKNKGPKLPRKCFLLLSFLIGIIIFISPFIYPSLKGLKDRPTKNLHPVARVSKSPQITVIHPVVSINNQSKVKHVASHGVAINSDSGHIEEYLKNQNFNGSVLVVKDNKVVINKGIGYADFENKFPNTLETVFYIGSITKVFIATSIMQLQEHGKLNITDPLSKYIPNFPHGKQIKLYYLLTHTSGIPQHTEPREKISQDDLMKKIEKEHLMFQPGTNWYYSDSNYSILGYIVEKVSGEPLDQYVKENIFNIAGMTHTGFGESFYKESFVSKGYKQFGDKMISPLLPDMSQLFGCGDIYSTTFDLYLFDKALYTGKLLSKNSLKLFFTPFKHNYALGLDVGPDRYSDHGVVPGWNCLNSFSKNGDEFTILLSNVQNGVNSIGDVNNQIYKMLRTQTLHLNI
jgi:CubicO group peptidase (beta-lactamase class C family)